MMHPLMAWGLVQCHRAKRQHPERHLNCHGSSDRQAACARWGNRPPRAIATMAPRSACLV
jgi:hypothetical protein